MDLQPNKIDGIVKPITNTRISASEWNQLVGSCMEFITQAGFTPDPNDNEQFLNAFKAIAASLELVGANTNLSNLTATGENHFVKLQSGVLQTDVDYVIKRVVSSAKWYEIWKSGWIRQGGRSGNVAGGASISVVFEKTMSNALYSVQITPNSTYSSSAEAADCVSDISTTGFTIHSGHIKTTWFSWEVEGVAAND